MMPYTNATDKLHKNQKSEAGWEAAIKEAENQIAISKRRIAGLKDSIRVFKKQMSAGYPWPGDGQGASINE